MKYFYDTEFIDNGRTIELISINPVSPPNRRLVDGTSTRKQ